MNIIYGRSGSGKSEYIYNKIKSELETAPKTYIITPEQFSFTAEKKLLETLDEGATTKVEVLSFERMAYRVLQETFGGNLKNIGKSGKAMVVSSLLEEAQKELNFLGKNLENIDLILTQITEFKKHGITASMLKEKMDNTKDTYLKLKIKDMYTIYSMFEDRLKDNYIDENDLLKLLEQNIESSHLFDNCLFYIDEFAGFTKQEYNVIQVLDRIAKDIYVTVCTDDLRVIKSPEADIFYDNKQTVQTLKQIADIKNEIHLESLYRFKNEELKHLEKNIFDLPYESYNKDVENIKLTIAKNQYEEIENVAREISKLVRKEGYRYRDIGVITKNLEDYSSLCKAIFSEYEIPVFIDEKKDITSDIFVKYVLAILDIFAKNWSYEAVFNYLKSGIIKVDRLYELENYCIKWNIKGSKWYEKPWNFGEEDTFEAEQKEVITPLLEFRKNLSSKNSADKISEELYKFIVKNTSENNKNNISQVAENQMSNKPFTEEPTINVDSYNAVIDVIDEIADLFKDVKMSFDTYAKLLKTGIQVKEIGQIPQTQDKVTVGDVNRSKTHKVRAIFIIGVNDGVFPSVPSSEGFFNDRDRENLKEEGIELAKGTLEKMYEENFNIYKAFSTAEEKLYISYPASDVDDKPLRKSTVISKIRKIFPKLKEITYIEDNNLNKLQENSKIEKDNARECKERSLQADGIDKAQETEMNIYTKEVTFSELLSHINNMNGSWYEVYQWYKNNPKYSYRLEKALEGLEYTNLPEKISSHNVQKLYGDTLHTTVSRLEQYKSCEFSYYLKYGLKLSSKEKMDIKPVDTGSFMHDVVDTFFKENENIKEISDEELKQILDKIIEEKLSLPRNYIFTATAKYRNLVRRLKKVIFYSMKYIVQSLKNSEFDVMQTELEFGNNTYPPIEMTLDDGKRVSITGKIDRIDIAKAPNGKYIRIIDYKSSTKDIELNKVIAGLQLQLLTYVDAITQKEEAEPAGALYFSLIEPKLASAKKEMSKEEIEQIIKKNYKMNGLVLADINVIKMMDKNLQTGKSEIIPVELNNSGEINYKNSKTVTKEEFENLQKYTIKLIKQISKEILDGNIDLKPYYAVNNKKTPCSYCEYKSICQFNPKLAGNKYNYIGTKSRQEILDEISKRVND